MIPELIMLTSLWTLGGSPEHYHHWCGSFVDGRFNYRKHNTWKEAKAACEGVFPGLFLSCARDNSGVCVSLMAYIEPDETSPEPPDSIRMDEARLTWEPPTKNEDGSILTDLSFFSVYGQPLTVSAGVLLTTVPEGTNEVTIEGLNAAVWAFDVTASDDAAIPNESIRSNMDCKDLR